MLSLESSNTSHPNSALPPKKVGSVVSNSSVACPQLKLYLDKQEAAIDSSVICIPILFRAAHKCFAIIVNLILRR